MVALKKEEILNSLERISKLIEKIVNYPEIPIINFLSDITKSDIRVYQFISKLRYLSYYEDAFIDSINNDDIDLTDLRDRIFLEQNTKNRFSNKQIIKYIRNAFSHSNIDKELYQISLNGKYLEVHLKNTKPCEFHIRMTFNDLEELVNRLKTTTFYLSVFENNKFKRFYLKSKITEQDFCSVYDNISNNLENINILNEDEYSKEIIQYYIDTGKDYEIREYDIMPEQLKLLNKYNNTFEKIINRLNKKNNNEKGLILNEGLRNYQLSKIIPLQEEKLSLKENNLLFIKLMTEYPNYSFKEIEGEFISTGYNLFNMQSLNEIQNIIFNDIGYNLTRAFIFNGRDLEYETFMEYISYYIMNICTEDSIKVDNKIYSAEHMRNAFAHGRWFIDHMNNLILCDTKNGKYNDYNFYWKEKINIFALLKEIYIKEILNEEIKPLEKNIVLIKK